ncbi:unnamed protein product [Alternaria alternata]
MQDFLNHNQERKAVAEGQSSTSLPLVPAKPKLSEPARSTPQSRPLPPTTKLDELDSVASKGLYVYGLLTPVGSNIRLIKVHRASAYPYPHLGGASFGCTIDVYEIDRAPPYIALSYTWGASLPTHRIWLNGKCWFVRENLYNFLNAFSQSEKAQQTKHIWVDSLCINQTNIQERNHQVGMMAEVYGNSHTVITWLDDSCYQPLQRTMDGTFEYKHFEQIFGNRYFTRIWIVQEIVLAQKVQIMSGDLLVDWLHFRRTFSELERTMLRRNNNIATWLFSDVMTRNPSGPKSKFLWSLSDRLDLYSQFECEDPRDKVYGLLGIVNRSSSVPEIDYNKSIQQVYFDTVRILLTEKGEEPHNGLLEISAKLSHDMHLCKKQQRVLSEVFGDIRRRVVNNAQKTGESPVVDAIGFRTSGGVFSGMAWGKISVQKHPPKWIENSYEE